MPTPALYHSPAAQTVLDEVPPERRTDYVDLFYAHRPCPGPASPTPNFPTVRKRSRSQAFGSARVALLPEMGWDELLHHSLSNPRDTHIALELGGRRGTRALPGGALRGSGHGRGHRT